MLQGIKLDQVAFCARTDQDEANIKDLLQLTDADWVEDIAMAEGVVGGQAGSNTAKLLFNYDLDHEVEILRYLEGPNYLDLAEVPSGQICHLGMHYVGDEFDGPVPRIAAPVIQSVVTKSHTNKYVRDANRHYRYTIYDTRGAMGVFLKIIERLQW